MFGDILIVRKREGLRTHSVEITVTAKHTNAQDILPTTRNYLAGDVRRAGAEKSAPNNGEPLTGFK